MPSSIRSNRSELTGQFSVAGFTVFTGAGPAWYEVAVATDAKLLLPQSKPLRNATNFYSSRAAGPLSADRGEAVYLLPPPVLARFAGQERLYYALATYRKPEFSDPEIVRLPPEVMPSIRISKSFSGRLRRSMIAGGRPGLAAGGNGYGTAPPESLIWGGDVAAPGKMEPVAAGSAPAPTSATQTALGLDYDDGYPRKFWARQQEAAAEGDERGIEGPIPDQPAAVTQACGTGRPSPQYPQASRFEPADSGNYRHSTSPRTINRIVIHISDGGPNINGTISWFKNPAAQVSAHYVVGQDGEVVQMVLHDDVAWHASSANGDSIGIENVANTRGLNPTPAEYCAAAALTRWLCDQYGIPLDRTHILGHSEADPRTTHTGCPNAVWDWDYFMGMVTSGTCYEPTAQGLSARAAGNGRARKAGAAAAAPARPLSAFDINWDDVGLVPQPTNNTCWAAAASMVVGWRDQVSVDLTQIPRPSSISELARIFNLVTEAPQCYTVDGLRNLIETKGPLWVAAKVPGFHAIVVTGIYGGGNPDDTYVRIKDPWARAAGTPDNPGAYQATPGAGSEYDLTFRRFVQEYEAVPEDPAFASVTVQILHSGGTGGRSPRNAAGFSTSQAARTLGQSFDIRWNDVELVQQRTDMSCWAAAAAMVVGWRDQICIDPEEIARGAGRWREYQGGLFPRDHATLARAWGLVAESPQCYTIEGFREMLRSNGPLWVGLLTDANTGHAVVVTGLYGDGEAATTNVVINDPAQAQPVTMTYRDFTRQYESRMTTNGDLVNVQILHSGGTSGRLPIGFAQGYAVARAAAKPKKLARAAAVVEVVSAIAGAAMTRILDNEGDISWELDQLGGLKHVDDNAANAGSAAYSTTTINVDGPHASTVFGLDEIYADFELKFDYNGRSLGKIRITPVHTNDAVGLGLKVKATIMDETNAFTRPPATERFAAVNVQFHYRFTSPLYNDLIAITELRLYGDGRFDQRFRWTQN